MRKIRNGKGITLIALIITIIILLILAMITIRILMNQGIIKHAQNATNSYTIEQEKERIALGYQNYKMDKVTNANAKLKVDGANGNNEIDQNADKTWTIIFDDTQNEYTLKEDGTIEDRNIQDSGDNENAEIVKIRAGYEFYKNEEIPDVLLRYCLGNDETGRGLQEIVEEGGTGLVFIDLEPIANASEELQFKNISMDSTYGYILFSYQGHDYQLKVELTGNNKTIEVTNALKIDGAEVNSNEASGWNIRFHEAQHAYTLSSDGTITPIEYVSDLDLLRNYFLGTDRKGRKYEDVFVYEQETLQTVPGDYVTETRRTDRFQDDTNSITNASSTIQMIAQIHNNKYTVLYNNVYYDVTVNEEQEIFTNVGEWDEPIVYCDCTKRMSWKLEGCRVTIYYNKSPQPWENIAIKVTSNDSEMAATSVEDKGYRVTLKYELETDENFKIIITGKKDGQDRRVEYQPEFRIEQLQY